MKAHSFCNILRLLLFCCLLLLIPMMAGTAAAQSVLKHIYFTDGGTSGPVADGPGTVKRVNPDATGLTTLVTGLHRPRGITNNH